MSFRAASYCKSLFRVGWRADYGTGQPIRRRNPGSGGRTTNNSSTQEWVSCAAEEGTHSCNAVFTDFVPSPPRAPCTQRTRWRCCAVAVASSAVFPRFAGGFPCWRLPARPCSMRKSRLQTGVPEFCPSSANSRNTCHAVLGGAWPLNHTCGAKRREGIRGRSRAG